MLRKAAQRTAINAPMQGTAADLIKLAMLAVDAWIDSSGVDARLMMQVHDELVFELPPEEEGVLATLVKREMEGAATLDVPLLVEMGVGDDWVAAKS